MDNRPSRGRGGHWKRGGGGGDAGSSGEQRGRGRGGHHRGRGKRDHRGRGQYHGPPADFRRNQDEDHADENKPAEEESDPIFPRRKLESNWVRYEESERKETNEDVPTQRGTDYHVLLSSAGDSYTQFRFSDEKDWEMDSLAINQIPGLFIDLPALSQKLEMLPLHTRLNLEAEVVQATPVQLPSMKMPHRTDTAPEGRLKTPQVGGFSGLDINCTVKSLSVTTPSPTVSTTIQPPKDDVDRELDLLLSLQNPITELASVESKTVMDETPNNPGTVSVKEEKKEETVDGKDTKPEAEKETNSARPELTEKDLEDWLDSMIS
ncbi:cell death regulator Aven [Triplophysa dalaica]|uniref:cell death regulator Aven n=1 Tax=Triplophysa dalaica TaxID=1582913 RepID=UPI0024DFB4CC|nr:cell death regulator Aven [Triplophysa dalaica]